MNKIKFNNGSEISILNPKGDVVRSHDKNLFLSVFPPTELDFIISKIKTLLERATENIENKEIYEHGYPEARLIPSDFYEQCEKMHKEFFIEEISGIVGEYLDGLCAENWND